MNLINLLLRGIKLNNKKTKKYIKIKKIMLYKEIGNYLVSEFGDVYLNNNLVKPYIKKNGYIKIRLKNININLYGGNRDEKEFSLHRLVYTLFIGEIPKGNHIHHIDGDVKNNHYTNLESMTNAEHQKTHKIRSIIDRKIRDKEYYKNNKEKRIEYQLDYYNKSKDNIIQKQKEYYQKNKEQRKEYRKKRYLELKLNSGTI